MVSWLARCVETSWAALVAACAANPWRASTIGLLIGGAVWWCVDRIRKKFARRCTTAGCRRILHQERIVQMFPAFTDDVLALPEPTRRYWYASHVFRQCGRCGWLRIQTSHDAKRFTRWALWWRRLVHPKEFLLRPELFTKLTLESLLPPEHRPVQQSCPPKITAGQISVTPPPSGVEACAHRHRIRRFTSG